jgi:hypothetical protein
VLIGKHQLVYHAIAERQASPPAAPPSLGDTMSLDTAHGRELRASLDETRVRPVVRQAANAPVTPSRIGVLQVIAGRAEQTAYQLVSHTSLIGKSGDALVRLEGWFKPAVAVAITRSSDGYIAMPMGGRPTINNQRLQTRQPLQDGDVLSVNGLVLEFRWTNVAASEPAA